MSHPALQIRALTKTYRGRHPVLANDGVDLDIRRGQVVGLLGHNGAGKTTLVSQVVGLARPDSGTISLAGIDAVANPAGARRRASVQAQANVPITGLTPRAAIALVGRIRGGDGAQVRARTAALLDALDMNEWADTPAEKVSGGVARLTACAMAAVVPGDLVVLDEPTNDVDPVRRRLLWDLIGDLAREGAGVLLVTHNVAEAERAVDSLVILDHGRVVAAGTPQELTASLQGHLTLDLDVEPGAVPQWPSYAEPLAGHATHASAHIPLTQAPDAVAWAMAERAAGRVESYQLTGASLEDAYVALTGASGADAPAAQVA